MNRHELEALLANYQQSLRQADADNDHLRRERDEARRILDDAQVILAKLGVPRVTNRAEAIGHTYVLCAYCGMLLRHNVVRTHLKTHSEYLGEPDVTAYTAWRLAPSETECTHAA